MDLDYLDAVAFQVTQGNTDGFYVLSTGEQCYVCLAANRPDLCSGDSIAYMLNRIEERAVKELIKRHMHD